MENNYYTPSELSGAPAPDVRGQFNEVAAVDLVGPPKPDGLESEPKYDLSAPPSLNNQQQSEGGVGFKIKAHRTSGTTKGNFVGAEISFPFPDFLNR